jgi:hypothetical protein
MVTINLCLEPSVQLGVEVNKSIGPHLRCPMKSVTPGVLTLVPHLDLGSTIST